MKSVLNIHFEKIMDNVKKIIEINDLKILDQWCTKKLTDIGFLND